MYFRGAVAALLYSVLIASPAQALDFLHNGSAHSLNGLFGIPAPVQTARESDQLKLGVVHSNMFAMGSDLGTDERSEVLLDGERTRLSLAWHRPLTGCLTAGIELPLIAHADGYFDRAIEDWHVFFNLPNANREEVEPNELNVYYQDASGRQLRVDQAQSGIGDLRLTVQGTLACFTGKTPSSAHQHRRIVRFGLKLPTGRLRALSGSEETDFFADVTSGTAQWHRRVHARASAGVLVPGQVSGFSQQRAVAAYGILAAAYTWSPSFAMVGQLDWHTPLFDTGLTELGDISVQLSAGLRWRRLSGNQLEFAIVEDVAPDTGPDISVMLAWTQSLGAN